MNKERQRYDKEAPLSDAGIASPLAVRLEHFRALRDTGFIKLRPLTMLVGKNSSGKSSFLRFFPLLRQSIDAPTQGPIQWYGNYVDFGGFDETVSTSAKQKEIRFGFELTIDPDQPRDPSYSRIYTSRLVLSSPLRCRISFTIIPDPQDNAVTRFKSISIDAAGHTVHMDVDGPHIAKLEVNGRPTSKPILGGLVLQQGQLLPAIGRRRTASKSLERDRFPGLVFGRPLAIPELVAALRPLFHGNTKDRTIRVVANRIGFGSVDQIKSRLRDGHTRSKRWTELIDQLHSTGPMFQNICDLVVVNLLGTLTRVIDRELWGFSTSVRYIKPLRATAARYYRQQDLSVEEVDPEGRNLPAFLRSLSGRERNDFDQWMSSEIGWQVVPRLARGNISINIRDDRGREHNLADVGFGFSQLLPVLAQLWLMQRRRRSWRHRSGLTFVIEQPELHLHPGLQARVADILIRAIASAQQSNIDLRVVLETHSETIVNRVGERIAAGVLNRSYAAVVLFETDLSGEISTRTAKFDIDGTLQNWPFGFFDPE